MSISRFSTLYIGCLQQRHFPVRVAAPPQACRHPQPRHMEPEWLVYHEAVCVFPKAEGRYSRKPCLRFSMELGENAHHFFRDFYRTGWGCWGYIDVANVMRLGQKRYRCGRLNDFCKSIWGLGRRGRGGEHIGGWCCIQWLSKLLPLGRWFLISKPNNGCIWLFQGCGVRGLHFIAERVLLQN
jgi:hypothetical protein